MARRKEIGRSGARRASRRPGWAVVAGVNTYAPGTVFDPLHGSVFDAIVMYAFLTHEEYTNLEPRQCHLFLGAALADVKAAASHAEKFLLRAYGIRVRHAFCDEVVGRYKPPQFTDVREAVRLTAASCKPHDLLLMYMSGHGVSAEGERFVALMDTRPTVVGDTGLAVSTIVKEMTRSRTQRRVLLLDTCDRSPARPLLTGETPVVRQARDVALLTAAVDEQAFEIKDPVEGYHYGLFTRFISDGLARREKGFTTFGDLVDSVLAAANEWRVRNPWYDGRGPVFNLASRGLRSSIVLAGVASAAHPPLPATRANERERLYRWWDEGTTRILLHGEPGVGKSWIALAFAQDGPFDAVIEHDCRVGGSDGRVLSRLDEQVRGMRERPQEQHVLLLLDNLADPGLLGGVEAGLAERSLPARVRITILITSTISTLEFSRALNVRKLKVDPFDGDQAQAVLVDRVPPEVWTRFGAHAVAVAARFEFVPAVIGELSAWLEEDQGGRERTRVVPSRVSKSFEHVDTALATLTPSERCLLDAMAVCAARGFPLTLAQRLAGSSEPGVADILVARSLLRAVDRERQLFRLPPLVRAALRRRSRLDLLRGRHADLVRSVLDESVRSPSARGVNVVAARGVLLEVPVAARWLRRQEDFTAMAALLARARAVLDMPSPAERDLEERVRLSVRPAEEGRSLERHLAHAPGVYERLLWTKVLRLQAEGDVEVVPPLLEQLVTLHKLQNDGWREQACLALLAHLELVLEGNAPVAQARDRLNRREQLCRDGRLWDDLASCLGDQVVLRFASDTDDVGRSFEGDALADVAALLEAQDAAARRMRRPGYLPSEQGNLAAFWLAVKAWKADQIVLPVITDDAFMVTGHGSLSSYVLRLLSMLLALIRSPVVWQGAGSARTDARESVINPDMRSRWPEHDHAGQPDSASGPFSSRSWSEGQMVAEVAVRDVPGQHTRFWSVYRRLVRAWVVALPADAEAARLDALRRYSSSGDLADLETVIVILDAVGQHGEALDLLRSHAETAQAMKDDVSWLGAVVRHADLVSSAVDAFDGARAGQRSVDGLRLAGWRRERPDSRRKRTRC